MTNVEYSSLHLDSCSTLWVILSCALFAVMFEFFQDRKKERRALFALTEEKDRIADF